MSKFIKIIHTRKSFWISLVFILPLIIYFRWISFSIFTFADFGFSYRETISELITPSVWLSFDLGKMDFLLWKYPLNIFISLFGYLGFDSNISDKFSIFWIIILLPGISSFLLFNFYTKSIFASIIGSFIFTFNTYFLSINSEGHVLLSISFYYSIFALFFLQKSISSKKKSNFIILLILLFLISSYDLRGLYITVFILILVIFWEYFFSNSVGSKFSLIKLLFSLLFFIFLLNFYWLIVFITNNTFTNNDILSRALFGSQYYRLLQALTLYYPFWTGSKILWFSSNPIKFYFWVFPILAFIGFVVYRKNKIVLFYCLLSLIGILLSKQTDQPFNNLYPWLVSNIPGFNAFREASKFYYFIILGYSVLISFFIKWLIKKEFKRVYKLIIVVTLSVLCLWNSKPIITGEIESIYIPRKIPSDYTVLKKYLLDQVIFFRTLWIPRNSKWGIYTYNHPLCSAVNLSSSWLSITNNKLATYETLTDYHLIRMLNYSQSSSLLSNSSIKYVVVPIRDTANDDDFFIHYGNDRDFYIKNLDKLSYLKKIDIGTKDLVVYENDGYKPHIYTTGEKETKEKYIPFLNMEHRFINPTEYKIYSKNMSKQIFLNFAESYHPDWKIRIGKFNWFDALRDKNYFLPDFFHFENDAKLNSFTIDPEYIRKNYPKSYYHENPDGSMDVELTLYFKPQSFFYLGLIISGTTLIACLSYLGYDFIRNRKMK